MSERLDASPTSDDLIKRLRGDDTHEARTRDAEDVSEDITALITSAVNDEHPTYPLSDIHHAIANLGAASKLDALHIIPLLVGSDDPAAGEILSLLGECGNAKEITIGVQEALERLLRSFETEEEDVGNVFTPLERLLRLYIGTIPRIKLRKKSASESLTPLFSQLPETIEYASPSLQTNERREIVHLLQQLVSCSLSWASKQENNSDADGVRALCKDVFCSGLGVLSPFWEASLAQQKFERRYPSLTLGKMTSLSTADTSAMQDCSKAANDLLCTSEKLLEGRSTGSLILLAALIYSSEKNPLPLPTSMLSDLLPVLLASLQSPSGVDASLYVILSILFPPQSSSPHDLDPDLYSPLLFVLAPLSCANGDPKTRLIAFRIVGTLLSRTPPEDRMHLLRDLLTDSPPAMRVAAVGLLKDSVLTALSSASESPSPFASSALLRAFGSVILRPDPPNVFSNPSQPLNLQKFLDTQEPKRLVECLSLYYVLLMRDRDNLTGVRDESQIKATEKELMAPLRSTLKEWEELARPEDHDTMMSLAALSTAVERIDGALEMISGEVK